MSEQQTSIITFSKYGAIVGFLLGFISAIVQQNQTLPFALGYGIPFAIIGLIIGLIIWKFNFLLKDIPSQDFLIVYFQFDYLS